MTVTRLLLPLTAILLSLAACTAPGGTSSATRLDTLTPTTGTAGTAVEITGRIPADATLHLCGVALTNLQLSDPESAAATHFGRATGTTPALTPGTTCTLTIVRDGQTVPHAGATLTFTTDTNPPDAPTNLNATAGNASLAIDFELADDGGSPITRLEYALDDGASWNEATAAASPLLLAGLPNEQPITLRLRVTNAAGTSPISDPITATPTLWPFAARAGGTSNDEARGISALADGSAIITGSYSGDATFGPTTLTSAGASDVFVARVDPDGSWDWATSAGGADTDAAFGVSALADGSAIVTGYFFGDATFGATTLVSQGGFDVFIARVDPDGSWDWATSAGGTSADVPFGVSTLADGSAIVTGSFSGATTFGTTTLTSAGGTDVFVARAHPDGSWAWASRAGGTDVESGTAVSTLADGSAIVTGYFRGTANFGATTLVSEGGLDAFVAKANPDGSWAWATRAGGPDYDDVLGVSTLADGSAIISGVFEGVATFGATTLTSVGDEDAFVAKTNPDGSWAWATRAGGPSGDVAVSVSTLGDGSAITTGYFQGAAVFGGDAVSGGTTLTSTGLNDVFVAKTNPDGSWAWAARAGGSNQDDVTGVDTLADGSAIVAGRFIDTANFGATTLVSAGARDVFVAKVNANGAW